MPIDVNSMIQLDLYLFSIGLPLTSCRVHDIAKTCYDSATSFYLAVCSTGSIMLPFHTYDTLY